MSQNSSEGAAPVSSQGAADPLSDFDFSVLNEASFKEDAVREEIVAPLLKAIGYRPVGRYRVVRSKALSHPFVRIGSRKFAAKIIPDYTLYVDDKPVAVLDAKEPSADIIRSAHVEQAYSYAVHPEIRCETFGLCNGRRLTIFSTTDLKLVGDFSLEHKRDWIEICDLLSPILLVSAPDDKYTAWFHLLGILVSPNTSPKIAASAASRLWWYMPVASDSRSAAVEAAMKHLSDAQILALIRAANELFAQLDGSLAEHVGCLLSYDDAMSTKLTRLLGAQLIPADQVEVVVQLVEFLSGGPRNNLRHVR
jgi:hypothetical protein